MDLGATDIILLGKESCQISSLCLNLLP